MSNTPDQDGVFDLGANPVHLGLSASVAVEPGFDGRMEWYEEYGARHARDGVEGRLVSVHTFTEPWDTWEMHPNGDELVACVEGEMVLHQELPDGETRQVTLSAGQAVVNRPGVWHTADVTGTATGLFITAGQGTEIRPR